MKEYIKGLVSIIVPTYNQEGYIIEAVESCLNQTWKDIEVIVVDDGSTDATRELLKPYIDRGLIVYIYQNNSERSAARNNGLRASKGEFIQFLDSDDLLDNDKIRVQVEYLAAHPEIFGVYCDSKQFTDSLDNCSVIKPKALSGDITHELVKWNFMTINSALIRRDECFFDESLNTAEDWDYWLRLSLKGFKFSYLDASACYVRWHGGNTSYNMKNMLSGELKVLDKLEIVGKYPGLIKYGKFQRLFRIKSPEAKDYLMDLLKVDRRLFLKAIVFAVMVIYRRLFNKENLTASM